MEHEPINSTVITSAAYDDDRRTLEVKLHNGRVYLYCDVPQEIYEGLLSAPSAGRYFNQVVRSKYEGELLYDPRRPRLGR